MRRQCSKMSSAIVAVSPAYGEDMDAACGCRGYQEGTLGICPSHVCDWRCDVTSLGVQQIQKERLYVLRLMPAVNALQ